jgi:hypothetical protein
MEKKFKILRIVAIIWKVVAWITLVTSVLGGCGCIAMGLMTGSAARDINQALGLSAFGALGGVIVAVPLIFGGLFYFALLYAVAEMIDVVLALEENTRLTAEQLKNITKS